MKYAQKINLQTHVSEVHNGIKYKCTVEQCDAEFGTQYKLVRHISTVHLKQTRFVCKRCNYKSWDNSELTRHSKICTGELNCSTGEYAVMKVLDEMGIEYEYNRTYKVKDKCLLRWDFILECSDDTKLFIEYNGRQHYSFAYFGGISQEQSELNFETQKKHDELKNQFCIENNYPILWIKYTDFGRVKELVSDFIIKHTDWGIEENQSSSTLSSDSSSPDD
jgi:hypothetical protein